MKELWAKADKDKKCFTREGQGKVHVRLDKQPKCQCKDITFRKDVK